MKKQNRYGVDRIAHAILKAILLMALVATADAFAAPTDLMLVLDNSGSMRKNDPNFLASEAVRDFVQNLDTDVQAGVIIFDQGVRLAVPLSQVSDEVKTQLARSVDGINYKGQLTDSPAAVERAIYELKTKARDGVNKAIVFMTDGIVDTGNPGIDVEKSKWLRDELSVDAADNGIKVYSIAFTENADFFLIQSLAKKTNGEYFRALTAADLSGVFEQVQNRLLSGDGDIPAAPIEQPSSAITESPATSPTVAAPPKIETTLGTPEEPAEPPATEEPAEIAEFDPNDPLAGLSEEDLAALKEISAVEGIPLEQLARELLGPGEGGDTPGVVITRPDEIAAPIESGQASRGGGLTTIIIAAVVLLLLVAAVVFFLLRRRGNSTVAEDVESTSAASPAAGSPNIPAAFLHDISGHAAEPLINLGEKPLMVGRVAGAENQHLDYLVVNVATVGRRHAVIKYKDQTYWVVDQGSVNGTYVNDERVSGERQLRHGDRIKFHRAEFEFTQPDLAEGGQTVIVEGDMAEATIVAEASTIARAATAAMAASSVASESADAGDAPSSAAVAAPTDTAASDGDDMFDMPDDNNQMSASDAGGDDDGFGMEFSEAPASDEFAVDPGDATMEEQIPESLIGEASREDNAALDQAMTDVFDVTGEDDLSPVGLGSSDEGDVEEDFDMEATAIRQRPLSDEELAAASRPLNAGNDADSDEFDADATALLEPTQEESVSSVVESSSTAIDEEFDAEASAFFDDITVGPVPDDESGPKITQDNDNDDDMFSVDGSTDDQASLDEKLERAQAIAEAADADAGIGDMATMVHQSPVSPSDPRDITLDEFIETDSFDAPKTEPPPMPKSDGQDVDPPENMSPENISLDEFVDTGMFDGDLSQQDPKQQADGSDQENTNLGDTMILRDGTDIPDNDGSEDPTELK